MFKFGRKYFKTLTWIEDDSNYMTYLIAEVNPNFYQKINITAELSDEEETEFIKLINKEIDNNEQI
jgi:hypothetical protein